MDQHWKLVMGSGESSPTDLEVNDDQVAGFWSLCVLYGFPELLFLVVEYRLEILNRKMLQQLVQIKEKKLKLQGLPGMALGFALTARGPQHTYWEVGASHKPPGPNVMYFEKISLLPSTVLGVSKSITERLIVPQVESTKLLWAWMMGRRVLGVSHYGL